MAKLNYLRFFVKNAYQIPENPHLSEKRQRIMTEAAELFATHLIRVLQHGMDKNVDISKYMKTDTVNRKIDFDCDGYLKECGYDVDYELNKVIAETPDKLTRIAKVEALKLAVTGLDRVFESFRMDFDNAMSERAEDCDCPRCKAKGKEASKTVTELLKKLGYDPRH